MVGQPNKELSSITVQSDIHLGSGQLIYIHNKYSLALGGDATVDLGGPVGVELVDGILAQVVLILERHILDRHLNRFGETNLDRDEESKLAESETE